MHDKLCCCFWRPGNWCCLWRHTPVIARILSEIQSDHGRGDERFSSKLRNSRRNGKTDLSCISVWNGTGLYYCQQVVACPSSKRLVKALRIGFSYLSEFIRAVVLHSAPLCIRPRKILRKCFVITVLSLPTHVPQLHRILYRFSVRMQKQPFHVFQLFSPEVKHFYQKTTWKNSHVILI